MLVCSSTLRDHPPSDERRVRYDTGASIASIASIASMKYLLVGSDESHPKHISTIIYSFLAGIGRILCEC